MIPTDVENFRPAVGPFSDFGGASELDFSSDLEEPSRFPGDTPRDNIDGANPDAFYAILCDAPRDRRAEALELSAAADAWVAEHPERAATIPDTLPPMATYVPPRHPLAGIRF